MKDDLQELKANVQEKKAVIGTERVLKKLRGKSLRKVFLASNCPDDIKEEVQQYASLAGVPAVVLEQNNSELGVFCKKRFMVSVAGI